MSDQSDAQRRAMAAGLCSQCFTNPLHTKWHCAACAEKRRARMRARTGSKPWRPGGPGRPPKGAA